MLHTSDSRTLSSRTNPEMLVVSPSAPTKLIKMYKIETFTADLYLRPAMQSTSAVASGHMHGEMSNIHTVLVL